MITKYSTNKTIFLLFAGIILTIAAPSLSHAKLLFLSSDIPITVGVGSFEESDILKYQPPNLILYLSGSTLGIPRGTNIDAFGFYGDNTLFSVDVPTTLDEATYTQRDLIVYDGNNFSKLLDGSAIGIPDSARIDAATVLENESIVFSTDIPVSLAGNDFKENDLIMYDGSFFNLYFSGSSNGIPKGANIDGVWVSSSGEILFSVDIPCSLAGLEVTANDIIKWSGSFFSIYLDGTSAGLSESSNMDAITDNGTQKFPWILFYPALFKKNY